MNKVMGFFLLMLTTFTTSHGMERKLRIYPYKPLLLDWHEEIASDLGVSFNEELVINTVDSSSDETMPSLLHELSIATHPIRVTRIIHAIYILLDKSIRSENINFLTRAITILKNYVRDNYPHVHELLKKKDELLETVLYVSQFPTITTNQTVTHQISIIVNSFTACKFLDSGAEADTDEPEEEAYEEDDEDIDHDKQHRPAIDENNIGQCSQCRIYGPVDIVDEDYPLGRVQFCYFCSQRIRTASLYLP